MPRDAPLALLVDLDRPAGLPDEAVVLRDAIHEFFHQRAQVFWQRLRDLFRVGRAVAIALGDFLASLMKGSRFGEIVRESLTIGGWVSMWRPLEIFLYDWWPVRREARLAEKLAVMPVRIRLSIRLLLNRGAPTGQPCRPNANKRKSSMERELSIKQADEG